MNTAACLQHLVGGENLSREESVQMAGLLTDENTTTAQISALLTALSAKGETEEEITGLIFGMREKMKRINAPAGTIDVCGTGGDGKHTFNISTAAAFVLAGAGIPVAKHGNRAASSLCGSADVLEALGVTVQLTSQQAESVLQKTGMVFLFAPQYHSAFKQVGQVRKELGIRTVFNLLGPFASPAEVRRQVIGVPNLHIAEKLASVATKLSYEHLCIVTGEDGMDEVSLFAPTYVFEIKNQTIKTYTIDPVSVGFMQADIAEIIGSDAATNAAIIRSVLLGKKGPARDIVVLNSALGCIVAGKAHTFEEGIFLVEKSIDTGAAFHVLNHVVKETQAYA